MGATSEQESDAYDNEEPAHQVTLSSYYIGETEVTQELWQTVMRGSNESFFKALLQHVTDF
jgi:formylglycine-generating enzyme required for sulfatase activity